MRNAQCFVSRLLIVAVAYLMVPNVFAQSSGSWQEVLQARLPLYGHRNWIVVADSAYPAQASAGIETIEADADQLEVLQQVLSVLSKSKHVRPIIHIDQELHYLREEEAPGVQKYRDALTKMLADQKPDTILHNEVIGKLDEASKTFRVLIIKTNMTIPYTSVFLQLDCAYWSASQEEHLRQVMAKH